MIKKFGSIAVQWSENEGKYEIAQQRYNPLYNKLSDYIRDGFTQDGEYLISNGRSIKVEWFTKPETSYTLAYIESDDDDWEYDIKCLGNRAFSEDINYNDFVQACCFALDYVQDYHNK